MNSIFSGS